MPALHAGYPSSPLREHTLLAVILRAIQSCTYVYIMYIVCFVSSFIRLQDLQRLQKASSATLSVNVLFCTYCTTHVDVRSCRSRLERVNIQ